MTLEQVQWWIWNPLDVFIAVIAFGIGLPFALAILTVLINHLTRPSRFEELKPDNSHIKRKSSRRKLSGDFPKDI